MSFNQNSNKKVIINELQHLGFRQHLPHPQLSHWIQCYWSVNHSQLTQRYHEKLYPDGGTSLVFNFADGEYKGGWLNASHVLHSTQFVGKVDSFGIRFHPGGAYQLLGLPVRELSDEGYCLFDANLIRKSAGLTESLSELNDLQRVSFVEQWLFDQATRHQPENGMIQRLWQYLPEYSNGINELLQTHGVGRRKFERLFRQQVDLSPNQLKQLLRVKKARQLIKQYPDQRLAVIAQSCGYYDQAHFIHQFQKITHQNPADYRLKQLSRLQSGEMTVSNQN